MFSYTTLRIRLYTSGYRQGNATILPFLSRKKHVSERVLLAKNNVGGPGSYWESIWFTDEVLFRSNALKQQPTVIYGHYLPKMLTR